MQKIRTKINNLPKALQFLIRIVYPILLYVLIHFTVIIKIDINLKLIQGIFMLIWAALEYYFFFSQRKN